MEKSECKKIERRNPVLWVIALLSLLMTAASVFCIVFPHMKNFDTVMKNIFFGVGAVGVLYFSYSFAASIYKIFIPQSALLIGEDGFYDCSVCNIGAGFIPWSKVKGIKVFGADGAQLLGISLKDVDSLSIRSEKVLKEIIENAQTGTPDIIYKQSEIKMPLRRLESLLNKASGIYETDKPGDVLKAEQIDDSLKTREMTLADIFSEDNDNFKTRTVSVFDKKISSEIPAAKEQNPVVNQPEPEKQEAPAEDEAEEKVQKINLSDPHTEKIAVHEDLDLSQLKREKYEPENEPDDESDRDRVKEEFENKRRLSVKKDNQTKELADELLQRLSEIDENNKTKDNDELSETLKKLEELTKKFRDGLNDDKKGGI